MNERYDGIVALRAIREFQDRSIAPSDLEAVLHAARWTGSSKNLQNWSFVVVDDPDQKDRLLQAGDFTTPIRNAPVAICLVQEPEGYEFDTGRLAQNIMLAADAIGLASCPITLHREQLAADVLGLPEDRRCRYAIAIGYPAPSAGPAKFGGRKPLDELVHRNTYGG
ncbi:MAG: nitroreductase family protein [Acidimicrobiia bacterium]|nr:MAG: nitroreductase family protein [Acidimicrobiia bacterium]